MSIRIDYPDTNDVYGDGSFFAWGDHQSPFTAVTKAVASWNGGSMERHVSTPGPGTCTWFVVFNGVPKNTTITLTIYGIKNNAPPEAVGASVQFTCVGHRDSSTSRAVPRVTRAAKVPEREEEMAGRERE